MQRLFQTLIRDRGGRGICASVDGGGSEVAEKICGDTRGYARIRVNILVKVTVIDALQTSMNGYCEIEYFINRKAVEAEIALNAQ